MWLDYTCRLCVEEEETSHHVVVGTGLVRNPEIVPEHDESSGIMEYI